MATRQTFKCDSCGYSCVISGGPDVIMRGPTETCVCTHCSSLVDVLIGFEDMESVPFSYQEEECIECEKTGGVRPWDHTLRRCPRCAEGNMKVDPDGISMCAD